MGGHWTEPVSSWTRGFCLAPAGNAPTSPVFRICKSQSAWVRAKEGRAKIRAFVLSKTKLNSETLRYASRLETCDFYSPTSRTYSPGIKSFLSFLTNRWASPWLRHLSTKRTGVDPGLGARLRVREAPLGAAHLYFTIANSRFLET